MSNEMIPDKVWNLYVTNYEEYECHELSKEDLREMLQEQWDRNFSGFMIGRDVDCIGRLGVFFYDDNAYVAYEDFEKGEWRCSYDLGACDSPDWDEMVRLTPDDTQDYSFRRCSIIAKTRAMQIVNRYLNSGELVELYLSDSKGKPVPDLNELGYL